MIIIIINIILRL